MGGLANRLRAIQRSPISGLFSSNGVGKLDPVMLCNIVVIRAPRPVVDMRPHIASHRTIVPFTARDTVIVIVEAHRALSPVPKVLRLDWVCVSPQTDMRSSGRILSGTICSSVSGGLSPLELLVVPRETGLNLIQVGVFTVRQENLADQAAVFVQARAIEAHVLARNEVA